MTIELALCLIMLVAAAPVSRSIAAHYAVFAVANAAMIGVSEVDSSLLAMFFTALAAADITIMLAGGRIELAVSAIVSASLALEQVVDGDWLLSQIVMLSAIANVALVSRIAVEYREWMRLRRWR